MDIRALRSLLAVIETGSLNKAAERLNVSQPALTKTVQRMEAQLGVKLFERDTRGVRATPFAEQFRAYAQAACTGYDQVVAELHASQSGIQSAVTIAGAPLLSSMLFPQAIVRVMRRNPDFRVKVESRSRDLLDSLVDGKVDIAVSPLDDMRHPGIAHRYLLNDKWVVIVRPDHPLARQRQVTAHDLHKCDWVYSDNDSFHRRRLERYFQESGLTVPRARIESRAPTMLKAVVCCSDYIGLVARLSVETDAKAGLLKIIELDTPMMTRPIGFLWREKDALSTAAQALMEMIETVCRERGYL